MILVCFISSQTIYYICNIITSSVGLEAVYKLLFPRGVLHQFWYSSLNDVSYSKLTCNFHLYLTWTNSHPIIDRLRYGVQLEKGVFDRRTADFLWMMIFGAFSLLVSEIIYLSFHLTIIYVIFFHWGVDGWWSLWVCDGALLREQWLIHCQKWLMVSEKLLAFGNMTWCDWGFVIYERGRLRKIKAGLSRIGGVNDGLNLSYKTTSLIEKRQSRSS